MPKLDFNTHQEVIMIYAFCSDGSFAGVDGGALISHTDIGKSKLGVLSDQMVNYFLNPTTLVDPRSVNPSNNKRLVCTPFGRQADGRMLLQFDNTRRGDGNDYTHIRPVYMEDSDATGIDAISQDETARTFLFNIIEYCFLQHTSTSTLPTAEQLDSAMTSEAASFTGYVAGSIQVSAGTTNSDIRLDNTSLSGSQMFGQEVPFYQFIQFQFQVSSTITITFKIWLGMDAFLTDYPLSTLVKVVWPCDPARLLDMDFANTVSAIVESASYKDGLLETAIKDEDHSGLSTYVSRYVNSSLATYYRMPFTVLYKGCAPSSADMRDYIREELLDLGLATEEEWKQVLPDLFVDGGFYLIPFYINRVTLTDGYVIDKNIIGYDAMMNKLIELFPNIDSSWIRQHGSLLMAAGSGLYIYAFPLQENGDSLLNLGTIHPTYQNIDANSGIYWDLMTEETQNFNMDLALAMKVALGLQSNDNNLFTEEVLDRKNYLAFISNFVEYHLLKEDSY